MKERRVIAQCDASLPMQPSQLKSSVRITNLQPTGESTE